MKKDWLYAACLICLTAACSGTPQSSTEVLCTIDVAGAMEKAAELKVSQLGSNLRYVALETTDFCLTRQVASSSVKWDMGGRTSRKTDRRFESGSCHYGTLMSLLPVLSIYRKRY